MAVRILPGLGLTGGWAEQADGWGNPMNENLRLLSALVQLSVNSSTTSLPASPTDGDIYIVPTADTNGDQIAVRDEGEWLYIPPVEGWVAYVRDTDKIMRFDGVQWVEQQGGGIPDAPSDGGTYGRKDGAWSIVPGIPDAPSDGNIYGRKDGGWTVAPGSTLVDVVGKTASHTLTLTDAGAYIRMAVAGANSLTVPAEALVNFDVGTVIVVRQADVGQTTFVPDAGVTINTAETLKLRKRGSTATLTKVDADEWDLTGDLETA